MKKTTQHTQLEVNGHLVPLKIYREYRRSVRASIGKTAVILRVPVLMTKAERENQLVWLQDWVVQQFEEHTVLRDRFFGHIYEDGDSLIVGERVYTIQIIYSNRKTHSARLQNNVIQLRLSNLEKGVYLQNSIRHLLSRAVAKDFSPAITRRVNELNKMYFDQMVRSVNLKYNQTNWGSCSAKGNLNLSTRLLFAPDDVIDYVIIHELAHLIELNHSKRYWKLVSDAMPDYKEKEKWLKQHGHLCDF